MHLPRAQAHLKAGVRANAPRVAGNLIVRITSIVTLDLGVLARGRVVLWVQDLDQVDQSDFDLFNELYEDDIQSIDTHSFTKM